MTLVAEESAKSKAAKEVIKSLTAQVILNLLLLWFLRCFTESTNKNTQHLKFFIIRNHFLDNTILPCGCPFFSWGKLCKMCGFCCFFILASQLSLLISYIEPAKIFTGLICTFEKN